MEAKTNIFANLTNFIDRLRILSVGQVMNIFHILH